MQNIIYSFCALPECHEMFAMRESQLGYKIYCTRECFHKAQRKLDPVSTCGLCGMEFPSQIGKSFCDEQCYNFRNLVTRRMIQNSEIPGKYRLKKFLKNQYGYEGRVKKFAW